MVFNKDHYCPAKKTLCILIDPCLQARQAFTYFLQPKKVNKEDRRWHKKAKNQ
jgi:hypothetical protein